MRLARARPPANISRTAASQLPSEILRTIPAPTSPAESTIMATSAPKMILIVLCIFILDPVCEDRLATVGADIDVSYKSLVRVLPIASVPYHDHAEVWSWV